MMSLILSKSKVEVLLDLWEKLVLLSGNQLFKLRTLIAPYHHKCLFPTEYLESLLLWVAVENTSNQC